MKVLVWQDLSQEAVAELEKCKADVKLQQHIFAERFSLNLPSWNKNSHVHQKFLMDILFLGHQFAQEEGFSDAQRSATVSIIKECIVKSFFQDTPNVSPLSLQESYELFSELIELHGVENSAKGSQELFSLQQLQLLVKFMSETFFKHYATMTRVFTRSEPNQLKTYEMQIAAPTLWVQPPLIHGKGVLEEVALPDVPGEENEQADEGMKPHLGQVNAEE